MKRLGLYIILLLTPVFLKGQGGIFTSYSIEQGLPQSQVLSIEQDRNGFMWFGTANGGVSKFDGRKFTTYTTTEGLTNDEVYSLAVTADSLWIGTGKGINIYANGTLLPVPDALKPLQTKLIRALRRITSGEVVILASGSVYVWNGQKLKEDLKLKGKNVNSIYQDHNSSIWFSTTGNGLIKKSGNLYSSLNSSTGFPCDTVWSVAEDSLSRIVAGTSRGPFAFHNGKGIQHVVPVGPQTALLNSDVRFVFTDKNKCLWFATAQTGLFRQETAHLTHFTAADGLGTEGINVIFQDREGIVWIGTDGGGVVKVGSGIFSGINEKNGLLSDVVLSITEDSKGDLWFGTTRGVCRVSGRNIEDFKSLNLPATKVWSVIEDKTGRIWISSYGEGVFIFNQEKITKLDVSKGLSHNNVRVILQHSSGDVWVGTANGLDRISSVSGRIRNYTADHGLFSNRILSLMEDSKGRLWIGTSGGGLSMFDDERFITVGYRDGLADNSVSSITEDHEGNIWCSTFGGVSRLKEIVPGKFMVKTITKHEGLVSNTVYVVKVDSKGQLFIGTNNGINKLNTNAFNHGNKIMMKYYGKAEGFYGIECNTNAVYMNKSGELWFGTIRGAIKYMPRRDLVNVVEPVTSITAVRLFMDKVNLANFSRKKSSRLNELSGNVVLPHNKNHITFDFISVCTTIPEEVHYRYKLSGFDGQWSPVTKETFATYSNLPPGQYTFMVSGRNNNGLWNREPVKFSFTIASPFWQTWWFYSLSSAFLFGGIYSLFSLRTRALKNAKEKLESQVKFKTNELYQEKLKVEEQKKEIESINNNLTANIQYARTIQESVLPLQSEIRKYVNDSFLLFQPRDIVSGDFYWFCRKGNESIIVAADCTGHGVAGAFMSFIGVELLNEIINVKGVDDPGEILKNLHDHILVKLQKEANLFDTGAGMDLSLLKINSENRQIEFSSSGFPVFIVSEGSVKMIKSPKSPVGINWKKDKEYKSQKLTYQNGDCLYMLSDGYCDQLGGPDGGKFLYSNFQNLLASMSALPMEEQEKTLRQVHAEWRGKLKQTDDILVIGFRL